MRPAYGCELGVAGIQLGLDGDGGRHRVHYCIELREHCIASVAPHLSAMGFDSTGDEVEICAEGAMSRVLILSG